LQGDIEQSDLLLSKGYQICSELQIGSVAITARLYRYIIRQSYQDLSAAESEINALISESLERKLTSYASIFQLLLSRLAYYRGDLQSGMDLFLKAIHTPIQIEGIWPSLIYQILLKNPPESVPVETRLYWKEEALRFVNAMAPACKSIHLKKKWLVFFNTIDKMNLSN